MGNYAITVNGNAYEITVEEGASTGAIPVARATAPAPKVVSAAASKTAPAGAAGSVVAPAPIPGKILGAKAAIGQVVKKGDVVIVLRTMKMENEIITPSDGAAVSVNVFADDSVGVGATPATLGQNNVL